MGRMTRKKAAALGESLHMDEDAVLELQNENAIRAAKANTPEPTDRAPLGELEPNSAESKSQSEDPTPELRKSTRGKKGAKKGGAKAKKNMAASTTSQMETTNDQGEVLPDENDSAPSPASEKAAEDLMKDVPELDIAHMSLQDTKPKKSQSAAVKLTRNQLAKQAELEAEPKTLVDGIGQTPEEQEAMKEEQLPADINNGEPSQDTATLRQIQDTAMDEPTSPLPNAVPKAVANLRADTPAKRSTSNKENVEPVELSSPHASNYDTLEDAAVSTTTPLETPRESASRLQDPIAALDALDDALESVNKDIPEVQPSPEKPKARKESKKAAPVVRTTKASQARISMAQNADAGKKQPSLGKPSPTKPLGRANSVRDSSTATRRVPSGSSTARGGQSTIDADKKEAVIPHSKPRPVSMSFPTPPPPPKSTKAPTQSHFQLPGEAVAAKLKAQREARMQREAEEEKKKVFKARPVPANLSKAPSVRQTTASKGRESLMTGKDLKTSTSGSSAAMAGGIKRANSVATTRPSAPKARIVSRDPTKPASTANGKPATSELAVKKRPSTAFAGTSNLRTSIFGTSTRTSTAPICDMNGRSISNPTGATKPASKGKEIFNRVANAKATERKEKAEKEAAAKKARAEAAERGRQSSREWAEKQKMKKMAAAKKTEVSAPVRETAVAEEPIVGAPQPVDGAAIEA